MATIRIILCPTELMFELGYSRNLDKVRANFHRYTPVQDTIEVEHEGAEAAEEAFDLTNNPYRQQERLDKYGRGRSVSAGDVVEVDGVKYACMSVGWMEMA